MLDNFRHVHFIGIGGSGISALAYLALAHNIKVSGSDTSQNPTIDKLTGEGVVIHIGHAKRNVGELCELVIYTEAIDRQKNPEYLEAERRGIPMLSYFQALGRLSQSKKTIVVSGTHGKTTTTAMLGEALINAKTDPTVIVGSRVPAFGNKNICIGHSEWLVAEGCEYRRSFLNFQPFGVVLTNCELDHPDYYKNEGDYVSAFKELVEKIPKNGFLVFNKSDKNCQSLSKMCKGEKLPVSLPGEELKLKVAGDFNQLNANLAFAAALQVTDQTHLIREALENFSGTARRMEVKGEKNGVLVIDDYGHHPTEIRVTLAALKKTHPNRRLICIFQPHQYSRTYELLDQFAHSFSSADIVIIPNIFEARDTAEDKAKISAEKLAQAIQKNGVDCRWGKGFPETLKMLKNTAVKGDLIVTMGAGDVYLIGEEFLQRGEEK